MTRPAGATRRTVVGLTALVVLAMLLRVAAIVYTHAIASPEEENRIIARNLAAGQGFTFNEFGTPEPTAIRGPAYPMLLAMLGPDRVGLALAVNVVVCGATVLAAFAMTRRLAQHAPPGTDPVFVVATPASPANVDRRNRARQASPLQEGEPSLVDQAAAQSGYASMTRAPWIAAALFAFWPTQVYAATLTQGLSIAVLLTAVSLLIAFRRTAPAALAGGVLAGLAALTEPALALPLLFMTVAIGRRGHGSAAALYLAAGCVIVAPWLYRNAIVFGGSMPITSNLWRDAFAANGPDFPDSRPTTAPHLAVGDRATPTPRIRLLPPADFDRLKRPEAERSIVLRTWTLDWVRKHPGQYLNRCLTRVGALLFGDYEHRLAARWWFSPFYFGLVVAALYVVPRGLKSDLHSVILLSFAGLALPMIVIMADARMIPLLDVPLLLAAADVFAGGAPRRSKATA